jgi:hypothetical protein
VRRRDCRTPLFALAVAASAVACAGEPPKRPNVMHPVHVRRAVEIVAHVFKDSNFEPDPGHAILLTSRGATLPLDVVAGGHKFGIAYVTREEAQQLGDALPKYDPESDALVVVEGIERDVGWHALLMYDRAYLSDDLEGEEHSATNIAAEKKIERDARDFIVKAQHEKW